MRYWLLDIRKTYKLTQSEVAEKASMARNTYAMIERGDRGVSVTNAKKIAAVLGFEWTIFFEENSHGTCHKNKQTC